MRLASIGLFSATVALVSLAIAATVASGGGPMAAPAGAGSPTKH